MRDFQAKLDTIGNNIANVNTSGFKAGRITFSDIMAQNVQGATAPDPNGATGGLNPRQIGLGSKISSIDTLFTDGSTQTTNVPTDLAISGTGFFMLQDPSGQRTYTRNGHFSLDATGKLVGDNGYYVCDANGAPLAGAVPAGAKSFSIDGNGVLNYIDSTGATGTAGQIGLASFSNPGGLTRTGSTAFLESSNSGTPTLGNPNSGGLGGVTVGALEMSNVDLSNEFTEMIVAQRAFQANTRIITTSDEILQELVNLKRN